MVKAKLVIVEPPMLEKTLGAAEGCGLTTSNIYTFDIRDRTTSTVVESRETLLQYGEGDFEEFDDPSTAIAAYQTTSGTSGAPKAAMISHSYPIAQAELRIQENTFNYKVCNRNALYKEVGR
jgi:acyl-CoA synthetase (AMP-forming)/AMP-acid ligase II